MLNFSEACERNKASILPILKRVLAHQQCLLEIGSGSGQHAIHFARDMPHLMWMPSELELNVSALEQNLAIHSVQNIAPAHLLDVCQDDWRLPMQVDSIFTANTLHIMDMDAVASLIRGCGKNLNKQGVLCVYGPFRYQGCYTSDSNAQFDQWLKLRNSASGIRDFEEVDRLAQSVGMQLWEDNQMPANNQLLVWRKG